MTFLWLVLLAQGVTLLNAMEGLKVRKGFPAVHQHGYNKGIAISALQCLIRSNGL